MHQTTKILIGIVLLVLLVPVTAYAQDLNSDLLEAAKQGDTATVKALLAKGADVNAKDKEFGQTALMVAAKGGHTEKKNGYIMGGGFFRVMPGSAGVRVEPAEVDGTRARILEVVPPQETTVKIGDYLKIVEALITKGADVHAKNKYGVTALMYAADGGHAETVEMLLAKGADVNAKDNDGWTALTFAAKKGYTKIVRLLKQAGAKE